MLGQNQKTEQRYGLTQSQMSIWTGQMLNPEVPLYNMVYTFDLKGEIDAGHFQKAFWGLIERSDALRTVFDVSNNDPHQQILSTLDYEIEILDWSGQNFSEEKLKKWLDERSQRVLDLSKRTFDSVLIKISGKRFVWYFNQHHLATDARSSSILFKKMSELYEMSVAGQIAEVSPFPAFVHYIKHEKEIRRNAEREAVNDYWQKKIDSLPNAPRLYGRSDFEVTTRSKRFVIDLGIERSRALRNLTKESDLRAFTSDLSLFNIFATVLFSYLHRTTGQNKLAIGTPVHNRTTLEFKETPGLFIEFFPFAGEVQNDDTFTSLFKRISMETYEFLRNAQTGAGTPDLNRSFNVILNYINTDFPEFNGIPGEARWLHPNHSDASHHLRLHVYNDKRSDTVQLYFDLNCGVFDESKFEDIPRHFLKLLDAFIEDRTQAIIKTSLLGEAEFQKIVVDFNKQTEIGEKGVLELFQTQVRENPQNIAISDKTQNFSYADLDKRSNKLANYLIEKGITDGERVGLYLKRSSDLLVGIFGALKAGCVYVPIAANNPPERVAEKINISESAIVLTHRELAENLEGLQTPVLRFDEDWKLIEEQEPTKPNLTISPENLAYIMFTSGSTGTPKGVKIAHRALGNYVNFAGKKYGTIQNPKFPLFTTIDFDLTITSIFVPLAIGGSIVIYEESDAGPDLAVLDVIEDDQIDIIKLTPSHLSLLKESDLSDSKIKTMIVGGEDLKADLAGNISDSFHDNLTIYNEYGPTEATVGCILHRFEADNNTSNSVPIGVPFANTKVYVLDENLNPVPPGVAGKLYLSGKSLADGYWNQFELTDQKFIPNPFEPSAKMYDTGDFVRLNGRGELEYLGRRDQQVKVGGIRMELGEIESAISSHPEISVCVVELVKGQQQSFDESEGNCFRCGLPRNYPTAEFDEKGVCNFCLSFESSGKRLKNISKRPLICKKYLMK